MVYSLAVEKNGNITKNRKMKKIVKWKQKIRDANFLHIKIPLENDKKLGLQKEARQ